MDQKVEEFRTSLRMSAFEHEIRFLRLHEKRAEILAELYKKLVEAVSAARVFVTPINLGIDEEADKKRYKDAIAIEKSTLFYDYFDIHRIFLNDELCSKLEILFKHIRTPIIEHAFFLEHPNFEVKLGSDKIDIWSKAWKALLKKEYQKPERRLKMSLEKYWGFKIHNTSNTHNTLVQPTG